MGKIVEKKKKKKGRPSLLDLQKRNIREQQEQQEQQQKRHNRKNANTNSASQPRNNYGTATTTRRSARRNPNPDDDSEEEDDELVGKRREKKLKLVLRLPPGEKPSASQDSGGYDSDAAGDSASENGSKKRKINAISDGSGNKGDKSISGTNQPNALQGALKLLDSGPTTPLPDRKLLFFVLDRLQKKDTYGVFSDPVDPEELPDYHEVISDPMDFGTVRKKLTAGAYINLEQFERDIFLLCSNAMQYNAPDTIYFRQARSIHELAKKNFENLRQDSDDNEPETKIVRRGRPPTKNLKKQIGRPTLESAGLELCEAARTSAGENATYSNHDTRKGSHFSDKPGLADTSGRLLGTRNNDVYSSWLTDNKFERNDEFTGSGVRGNVKNGIKQEESRRNTYSLSISSAASREPSVLMTFDGERKQLMPVGVLVEHGYARSLARFAANLGPVAWKVAAKKIERSLPLGVKYGPGWVGENDLPQRKMPIPNSSVPPEVPLSDLANPSDVDPKGETPPSTKQPREEDESPQKHVPPSSSAGKSPEHVTPKPEPLKGLNSHAGISILNSSAVTLVRPKSPFPGMNGFSITAHMGKLPGLARPPGLNSPAGQMLEKCSRNNSSNTNTNYNSSNSASNPEDTNKVSKNRGPISARNPPAPGFQPRPSWQGPLQQQRLETVPPDLNVRFQSPGSPSSSSRVDSTQPDLALQL